jgi:hypothetical protein
VATVQWPTSSVTAGDDVLAPLRTLLLGLNVLEGTDKAGEPLAPSLWSTPFSLQVITAGSTTISKWVGTAIAGLGGLSTLAAGLKAFLMGSHGSVTVGYAASAAACLVATIFGLAIVIRADVAGRAKAAAAEYEARKAVAVQFLALARPSGQYLVKKPGYGEAFAPVQAFVLRDGKIAVQVDDKTFLTGDDVEGLVPV